MEARMQSRLESFATAQADVAGRVLAQTNRWSPYLQQNPSASAIGESLWPDLWETLRIERRLITGMSDFDRRTRASALAPDWSTALHTQLGLNHALSDFHVVLGVDTAQSLVRLKAVQTAARAVLTEAELLQVTTPGQARPATAAYG